MGRSSSVIVLKRHRSVVKSGSSCATYPFGSSTKNLDHKEGENMLDFTKHFATRLTRLVTPQAERIPGTNQVPNSAGGYAWPVDKWTRFDRFLIFGSERGTY